MVQAEAKKAEDNNKLNDSFLDAMLRWETSDMYIGDVVAEAKELDKSSQSLEDEIH